MNFDLIFILKLVHYRFWPNFHRNIMHYKFWPHFHPKTIQYGFGLNFYPYGIYHEFRPNFRRNTIHHAFWPNFYPKSINRLCLTRVARNSPRLINLWPSYSRSIGIWKCWFLRREENRSTLRKTSRSKDENQQTQPAFDTESGNRTRATLVGSLRGRQLLNHCVIPAPRTLWILTKFSS